LPVTGLNARTIPLTFVPLPVYPMDILIKNKVLATMAGLVAHNRAGLLEANQQDLDAGNLDDLTLYDRLKIDDRKIGAMTQSLEETLALPDPVGIEKYHYHHPQGMEIYNRSAPFGTILIIYESRPDVTVEAAALAFKAGNKILLKGGKEARNSNRFLVSLWHLALAECGLDPDHILYLDYTREQTFDLLKSSAGKIDLVVPRGGDQLIEMVKTHASAPVLVSGRGNNFIYVHDKADPAMALEIILNSKLQKISVCNATDKVLIDRQLPGLEAFSKQLAAALVYEEVSLLADQSLSGLGSLYPVQIPDQENIWYEEFLARRILLGTVSGLDEAVQKINKYSGGHTAVIITADQEAAAGFMEAVDAASVIHNASSRFTDGGQFGLGAELAISTDKLHHRGPLGLNQLVTNKWYVYGNGQIRK